MDFDKKKYRELLIQTFFSFDNFCRKNGIKYYAAYGTLIGAVRHKGIIPWDDDIDVYMLRSDYDKFCSFKGRVGSHYDIMTIDDDNYWLLSLAKYVDTNTTLQEHKHYPLVLGVYVDIFPLDELPSDTTVYLKDKYDKYSLYVARGMMRYSVKEIMTSIVAPRRFLYIITNIVYFKNLLPIHMKKYLSCVEEIKKQVGDYLVSYDGGNGHKEILKKSYFEKSIELEFEGGKIMAPIAYDAILKQIYGDYMTLPPIEKRISHHSHYFVDLTTRYSLDQIVKIVNGKTKF